MFFSLRNRLFLIFTCILTIPFILLSFIIPSWFTSSIKQQTQELTIEMMNQYSLYVDSITTQAEDLGKQVLINSTTQQWLQQVTDDSELGRTTRNQLRMLLSSMRINNSNGMEISVFLHDGTGVDGNYPLLEESSWYRDFTETGQFLVKSHMDPYASEHTPVNSYILPLFNINTLVTEGIVKVNFPSELLETALSNITIGENGRAYLINSDGESVLPGEIHTPETVLHQSMEQVINDRSLKGLVEIPYDGDSYFVFYQKLPMGDWILITEVMESDLFAQVDRLQRNLFMISAIVFFATILASFLLSSNITSPLRQLVKAMGYLEKGDFTGAKRYMPTIKSKNNEIGYVIDVFDHTVDKLRNVIETEYKANLRRKDAEYKALLLQINPHFLNNTLEIIGGLAIQGKNKDVMNVSVYLGKMMRYSLDTKSSVVNLEEELKYIHSYTEILKLRYEDSISIHIDEDPNTKGIQVVKFILQPLVENAVKYSFTEKSHATISIKTELVDDQLYITVEDKGIGMSEEVINNLLEDGDLTETVGVLESKGSSIGLKNVLGRLKLYYGKDFTYEIQSEKNNGTKITLIFHLRG